MKYYKIKIRVNDGITQRNFSTYIFAESEETARNAIMNYWNDQENIFAEITDITERK